MAQAERVTREQRQYSGQARLHPLRAAGPPAHYPGRPTRGAGTSPVGERQGGTDLANAALKPDEVTALCTAAAAAWAKAPDNARKAPFKWKGRNYVASHTSFRLLVNTPDGKPVACRYD